MKKLFSLIGKILSGLIKFLQAALLIFFVVIWAIALSGKQIEVPESGALIVAPAGRLVDQLEGDVFDRALAEYQGNAETQTLVKDVVDSLRMAADDDRIKAVVLELSAFQGGSMAQLQRVGDAIDDFKASGKPVIVYGDGFMQSQYYLASRADEIYMHDLGAIYIDGFSYYRAFLKDAIDKLDVDVNVFRVGEFKSFVEPYLRNDMSEEDKAAASVWLESLWLAYRNDVEAARGFEPGMLDYYANNSVDILAQAGGDTARAAYDAGLIDGFLSHQEFENYIVELVGESDEVAGLYEGLHYSDYLFAAGRPGDAVVTEDNVAVVVASGNIVDGEAPPGTVGGYTLARLIREATMDDSIAAVVLQVDSPGGSMFASEVIYDQIQYLQQSGKPFVVSMSGVAASGGYYISMLADEIWARDTTITGSIGVGAVVPTFQRTLGNLGINIDGFGTTSMAGQFDPLRELGPDAKQLLTMSVESAYEIFVGKVADNRGMDFARADGLARGRVWIGADAHELGLIDQIGGIDDAIESAAAMAGLEDYGVRHLDMELTPAEQFVMQLAGGMANVTAALGAEELVNGWIEPGLLGQAVTLVEEQLAFLAQWNDPNAIYLNCECSVQ